MDNINTAPAEQQAPALPEKQPRVRRVGSITMGIALVVTGIALCAALVLPIVDVLIVAKCAPLLLVALGIEIIIASMRNDGSKIKYDFLSFFMCLFLVIGAIGASLMPLLYDYFGPARNEAQRSVSNDITARIIDERAQYPDVFSVTATVNFSGVRTFARNETAKNLSNTDWVSVYAELNGVYENEEAFAAAVLPLYKQLLTLAPCYVQLSAQSVTGAETYYEINLSGVQYIDLTPEIFAKSVTKYVYSEELNYYATEQENYQYQMDIYANKLREVEEQLAQANIELDAFRNASSGMQPIS